MTRQKIVRTVALIMLILVYTIGVCMLESCTRTRSMSEKGDSAILPSRADVSRLDLILSRYADLDSCQRAEMIDSFAAPLAVLLGMHGYSGVSDSGLISYSRSAAVKVFSPDAEKIYPDGDAILDTLGATAANIAGITGKDMHLRLFTIVTPYHQSIIIADSIVLVGLNHYLGEDYPGYNGVVASYLLPRKTRNFLPYALAEGMLASEFPFVPGRTSDLLSRMLYDGAIVYVAVHAVPGGTVEGALAWSDAQYGWAEAHEAEVWNTLIAKNLLFSTSETDAIRLLSPTPKALIISTDAPGQIGRFIGFSIVESYMKNNSATTLEYLLSPDFYSGDNILEKAGYHPR